MPPPTPGAEKMSTALLHNRWHIRFLEFNIQRVKTTMQREHLFPKKIASEEKRLADATAQRKFVGNTVKGGEGAGGGV